MKTYTRDELKEVLRLHALWLENNEEGNYADLSDANLSDADLSGANLSDANLRGANLSDSDLRGAIGNMREVRSIHAAAWRITFTKDTMAIGCQQHKIEQWLAFTEDEIAAMDRYALTFWSDWKEVLFKIIELSFGEK